MKITKRNILNLIIILIISSLLMGCSSETNSPNYVASSSQEDYSSLLEEATIVKIKEKFISFKKEIKHRVNQHNKQEKNKRD